MSVISNNSNSSPMTFAGAVAPSSANASYYGYEYTRGVSAGAVISVTQAPKQVAGLVPVFPCVRDDCRPGKYTADSIPDDANFMLPVFGFTSGSNDYNTDYNTFWFESIGGLGGLFSRDYSLEKLVSNVWVKQSDLYDNTLGVPFYSLPSCATLSYSGYTIDWGKVLGVYGEGVYRFSQTGHASGTTYVPSHGWISFLDIVGSGFVGVSVFGTGEIIMPPTFFVTAGMSPAVAMANFAAAIEAYQEAHPPQQYSAVYDPILMRINITGLLGQNVAFGLTGTANIDSRSSQSLSGGSIQTGPPVSTYCAKSPPFCLKTFDCYLADRTSKFQMSINGGKLGCVDKSRVGKVWTFCCGGNEISSYNIQMVDSIRVEGLFGYENTDYERKIIKYQSGIVNKIRDEAIIKFTWKAGMLPFWFHERFKAYALMADTLLASDYNINNTDYNIKNYSVQADSSYEPDYHGYSRYEKVNCSFKSGTQSLYRTRCC